MLLAALAVPAQTNQPPKCLRQPLRQFGGGWADLTPLFQWWEQQGAGASNPPTNPVASSLPTNAVAATPAPGGAGADRPDHSWRTYIFHNVCVIGLPKTR